MMKAIFFAGAFLCLNSCNYINSHKSLWEEFHVLNFLASAALSNNLFVELALFMILMIATIVFINLLDRTSVRLGQSHSSVANDSQLLFAGADSMARQVAHDIRAPLQLINLKLNENENLKNDPILKNALNRVNAIAAEVLQGSKKSNGQCELISTIQNILNEKKYLYRTQGDLIEFRFDKNVDVFFSEIDAHQFESMISNLLTNAIEARNPSVKILIKAELEGEQLKISIKDNGIGIANDKLKLVQQGLITDGKSEGNGLGVKHALKFLNSMGSTLSLDSILNVGTIVSFKVPSKKPLPIKKIDLIGKEVILIEDEKYIRKFWEQSAIKNGISLKSFESIEKFKEEKMEYSDNNVFFLDSTLRLDRIKGEEFAKELHQNGARKIYLVTGHEASTFNNQPEIDAILSKLPPWENEK